MIRLNQKIEINFKIDTINNQNDGHHRGDQE